jgi:hypothetical protein
MDNTLFSVVNMLSYECIHGENIDGGFTSSYLVSDVIVAFACELDTTPWSLLTVSIVHSCQARGYGPLFSPTASSQTLDVKMTQSQTRLA